MLKALLALLITGLLTFPAGAGTDSKKSVPGSSQDTIEKIQHVLAQAVRSYRTLQGLVTHDAAIMLKVGLQIREDEIAFGLVVTKIVADSPADKAGVKSGYEVLNVNGTSPTTREQALLMLETQIDGKPLALEILDLNDRIRIFFLRPKTLSDEEKNTLAELKEDVVKDGENRLRDIERIGAELIAKFLDPKSPTPGQSELDNFFDALRVFSNWHYRKYRSFYRLFGLDYYN